MKIKEFEQCDFTKIFEHFEVERARKKALSAAEKKEIKAKKDEAEAKYVYCMLDGRKEKVVEGNSSCRRARSART